MSQSYQPFPTVRRAAGESVVEARAKFITRTYNHLFLAIVAFAAIEYGLFKSGLAPIIYGMLAGTNWLLVLGGFMVTGWLASRVAHTAASKPAQYVALFGFVAAHAVLFLPLLFIADARAEGAIQSAGIVTMLGFAGLTAIAFTTRKDFSFLGGSLRWAGLCALLLIAASVLFGLKLGTFFSVAMVAFAGAAILYDTSNVLRHFPEDRYVAAALQLFASVALMFWYVLRLFVGSRD